MYSFYWKNRRVCHFARKQPQNVGNLIHHEYLPYLQFEPCWAFFSVRLFHCSFFLLSGERGEKGERGNHAFINEIWPLSGKFWSIFIASTEGFPCSSIRQINLLIQTKLNKSIEEYIFWNDRKSFLDVLWSKREKIFHKSITMLLLCT